MLQFYFNHKNTFEDEDGRYVMVTGTIGGIRMTLLNFMDQIKITVFFFFTAFLIADKAMGIILVGEDFNCVMRL